MERVCLRPGSPSDGAFLSGAASGAFLSGNTDQREERVRHSQRLGRSVGSAVRIRAPGAGSGPGFYGRVSAGAEDRFGFCVLLPICKGASSGVPDDGAFRRAAEWRRREGASEPACRDAGGYQMHVCPASSVGCFGADDSIWNRAQSAGPEDRSAASACGSL